NLQIVITLSLLYFFFQAEDGIRDRNVTGVQTCALPIYGASKAALLSMTQMLALELARAANLRFNAIDPGPRTTALRKAAFPADRSEERRVGKECRARGAAGQGTNNTGVAQDHEPWTWHE